MAFKNLEQRFNENVNKLYAGSTLKFDNGKASNGKADAPLIVRAPGKGYWTKFEDRSVPVQSTIQDVKRLTLFQLSKPGLLFLAKQQLLQTGNTFEFTRALNPAFVVCNAVPYLHIKRNLRPLNELVSKTDTSFANVKSMGQLQMSTYNALKSRSVPTFYLQEDPGPIGFDRPGIGKALVSRLLGPLKALKDTAVGALSAFNPLQKRNVGEKVDKWGPESWKVSRPELSTYIPGIQKILLAGQEKLINDESQLKIKGSISTVTAKRNIITYIKYFNGADSLKSNLQADSVGSVKAKRSSGTNGGQLPNHLGKISYIKDPANAPNLKPGNGREAYKPINSDFTDPIVVSFAMGKDDPIRFRAFIKDLQQTATPEYKSYQYIGRIEKFVNYTGVQREISFKLAVIAFSRTELDAVWRRINYLTGLVFPYGFNKGLMQPNIVRLTIGNVYVDQPGYVTGLSTNFNDATETWEIDAGSQVPIGATMDIKFTIIEKSSKIADSPFYGITEGPPTGSAMSGFSKTIPIPERKTTPVDPRNNAPKNETVETVSVESRDKKLTEFFRRIATVGGISGGPVRRP